MKTIKGTFYLPNGKPAANARLILEIDKTAHTVIGGEELAWPEDYADKIIQLDEHGEIPPGTKIVCNDELIPEDTDYKLRLVAPGGDEEGSTTLYSDWISIAGAEPIDIPSLDPQLLPVPPTPPPPPPPPFGVRRSTKASGFFGGIVHPPTKNVGPTSILYNGYNEGPQILDRGLFKIHSFALSRRFTIDRVSIHVHTPSPVPGQEVLVALYDLQSRNKLCDVAIDATKSGPSTGVFAEPITLAAGNYGYAWATSYACNVLRVSGLGYFAEYDPIASHLMNLGGENTPILTEGIAKGRKGKVLPKKLGVVEEEPPAGNIRTLSGAVIQTTLLELPILAYFDQAEIPASRSAK